MTTKSEREVEKQFLELCESLGIRCEKLKLASESSWPDRTLLYKGMVMFFELKRKGETPTPLQAYTLGELQKAGFEARWSNDWEQMRLIVIAWRQYVEDVNEHLDSIRTGLGNNRRT